MLLTAPSKATVQRLDALVIGSGAVGLTAAAALSRSGRRVLVIESGGTRLDAFETDSVQVIGRPHQGVHTARSRALGGTTNLWGGQLVEFQPADLLAKPTGDLPGGWPLSFSDLQGYYAKTYDSLGQRFVDDREVLRRIDIAEPSMLPELSYFLTRWMRRPNVAQTFEAEIRGVGDGSFDVLLDATVHGFATDDAGVTAVHLTHHNDSLTIEAPLVFLAAGTVENVRLLLADTGSPHPWSENDKIGAYFQDHLGGIVGSIEGTDVRTMSRLFSTIFLQGDKYMPKVRSVGHTPGTGLSCSAMIGFDSSATDHLVYLKQLAKAVLYRRGMEQPFRVDEAIRAARYVLPLAKGYLIDHRVTVPRGSQANLLVQAEQAPRRDSRLIASKENITVSGLPKLQLDWRWGDLEQENILIFTSWVAKWLAEEYGVRVTFRGGLDDLARPSSTLLHDTYHQAGGLVMGVSPDHSVVDPWQVVHGTRNMVVLGACTFPSSGDANSTFTAMALALRAVDHVVGNS